ncbi:hypothetical protein CEXT_498701 [Caerostris extrusa]|uniref:Uncharacterized protein n=1 Tax=Caerostris extrusa TaxID=172846 RepID=A0AAV4TEZ5_CAEEX|nr:hypothetical protein CEXT_498701 [Caerostris extrusa]
MNKYPAPATQNHRFRNRRKSVSSLNVIPLLVTSFRDVIFIGFESRHLRLPSHPLSPLVRTLCKHLFPRRQTIFFREPVTVKKCSLNEKESHAGRAAKNGVEN